MEPLDEENPNRFNYARHARVNSAMLAEIGRKMAQSNKQAVVALKHDDGRVVTVNASTTDEAFKNFTAQGFKTQPHEQHLLESPKIEMTPEHTATAQRLADTEDTLSALSAKFDALQKSQTGKSAK